MGKTKDCCKLFISKYLWDPCSWQNSKMAPMNIALRVTPAVILPKEGWAPKNWCFQTVVLEKTLDSPLGIKEIKPVNPKGIQPWIFNGRTDAEAPILWPPEMKRWLIVKDSDPGKDWGKRRRERQRMRCLDVITNSMSRNLSTLLEAVKDREA